MQRATESVKSALATTKMMAGDNDDAHKTDADAPVDDSLLIGGEILEQGSEFPKRHYLSPFHRWFLGPAADFQILSPPQDKAASVLSILGSESSLRDCENQLMELFDYQSHHIIQVFIKNRDAIAWCTKLMRSDADERVNVEVAMREKGVGWILRELAGGGKETKERVRRDGALTIRRK